MNTIRRILFTWFLAMASLSLAAKDSCKTTYMQLNPVLMDIYHELDSVFPLHYLANESPAHCAYWVNFNFSSREQFERYRPWVEALIKRLDKVQAYTRTTNLTDSMGKYLNGVELVMKTPNSVQKDNCVFYISQARMSFHYNACVEGEGFRFANDPDDPNGQPRQDIADHMDRLLSEYVHRKGVEKDSVCYPQDKDYRYVTFNSTNGEPSHGYRYIVPGCTEEDFRAFSDAIHAYSRTAPVRTSFNDNYWQYEAAAICVIRPNGQNPLMVAAALRGTRLYLLRIEGEHTCFMPRAWEEEDLKWEIKERHKLTERQPLPPPTVVP